MKYFSLISVLLVSSPEAPPLLVPAVGVFDNGACGCVLVEDGSIAVTAAHCIEAAEPKMVQFGQEWVTVERIEVREEWDLWHGDIAVLVLSDVPDVDPIPLMPVPIEPRHTGARATVVGWSTDKQLSWSVRLLGSLGDSDKILWVDPPALNFGDSGGAVIASGHLSAVLTTTVNMGSMSVNYGTEVYKHLEWIRGFTDGPEG